jgi:AraC-like DNA-binding protein
VALAHEFRNQLEIGDDCFEIFLTSDAFPEMPVYGVHMAGIAHLKPPYLVERIDPTFHTLLFTSSGRGSLTNAKGTFAIESETMAVMPAHANLRFEIDSDHWDMCWILLPTSLHWNALMPAISEIRSTAQALNIFHLSHVIDQERHLHKSFREHSFAQFARYIELNLKANSIKQEDRLVAAFAQVEQSLHKPWSVADIAKLTFYSEPHLYRLCKERYGKSPKIIVRELRIERAKQLLDHTDWTLSELAQRLGFSDQFNFSHRFKKAVGVSPDHFRKQKD